MASTVTIGVSDTYFHRDATGDVEFSFGKAEFDLGSDGGNVFQGLGVAVGWEIGINNH